MALPFKRRHCPGKGATWGRPSHLSEYKMNFHGPLWAFTNALVLDILLRYINHVSHSDDQEEFHGSHILEAAR